LRANTWERSMYDFEIVCMGGEKGKLMGFGNIQV